jgi:glycosyltransferase involved in cell wall biosynthesis
MITRKPYAAAVLLCGDVPHEVTLRVIMESDVFLRTTIYDGDSIAVREALHLDTPVIATDNGMRPEQVRLIPHSDPEALRNAIGRQLSQPKRLRPRAHADEKNIEAVYELYVSLAGALEGRNTAIAGNRRTVE